MINLTKNAQSQTDEIALLKTENQKLRKMVESLKIGQTSAPKEVSIFSNQHESFTQEFY